MTLDKVVIRMIKEFSMCIKQYLLNKWADAGHCMTMHFSIRKSARKVYYFLINLTELGELVQLSLCCKLSNKITS